jgi:hypothetical protein
VAGLRGLRGFDQHPREDGVVQGDIYVQPDRSQGVEQRGQGGDVSLQHTRFDEGLPVGPRQPPIVEAVPLGLLDQVGGEYRGTVQLTGFGAHCDLHETRVRELYGPAES